jgi:hypothetical protein
MHERWACSFFLESLALRRMLVATFEITLVSLRRFLVVDGFSPLGVLMSSVGMVRLYDAVSFIVDRCFA